MYAGTKRGVFLPSFKLLSIYVCSPQIKHFKLLKHKFLIQLQTKVIVKLKLNVQSEIE
jgi:hypothetical protein